MKDMTNEDIIILKQQDDATLAKWWCELNVWRWPSSLPNPEPTEWIPGGRRCQIRAWIGSIIGTKECLRQWNINTLQGAKFDEWYDAKFPSSSPTPQTIRQQNLF